MERTQPSPPPEAPSPLARYGRGKAHVEAQVRTMLGEIADRLERHRPDQALTATARIAVMQATTLDPVLSRALNIACPEITQAVTRGDYAVRLREIAAGGDAR